MNSSQAVRALVRELLENYRFPELMAYMAAAYYRYFNDPEFVGSMMARCEKQLQDTLGRDIQDRLCLERQR
jgi:hypothetical protein